MTFSRSYIKLLTASAVLIQADEIEIAGWFVSAQKSLSSWV